jgi:hypothetical protein
LSEEIEEYCMNSIQVEAGLLINEWQLGTQLNVAVTDGTRDKFNLLLSLLSDDARDFSQFELPKATQASLTEVELRESLSLREPQPLVNHGLTLSQAKNINESIQVKDLCSVRLQSMINNEAILSRADKSDFDTDVVDNLSFLSQTRLKHGEQDEMATVNGIDHALMAKYQDLNLEEKPLKVHYR